ncbi:asparagine synthetase B family protein, partial [Vicingaceae bacterium]|nr:asparagine synthetase B family protein [Vicingaceae bacterium]
DKMLFASEMKAIFSAGIQKRVSDQMIYKYLVYDVVENPKDKSETFFKEICQLPPSSFIKVNLEGEMSITKYWEIDLNKKSNLSLSEAKEKFTELFDKSVTMRLRSDVKVGSSFSGGLDSSSIVGSILNQSNPIKLNTFTARFDDKGYDEGDYVGLMTDRYSFNTNFCWPNDGLILDELDKIFYHQEEPFGSTSIIAQWEVMKLAKNQNVTVLLDGQGADETLAGYYKYFEPYLLEIYKSNRFEFTKQLKAIESNLSMTNVLSKRFFLGANFPKILKGLGDTTRQFRMGNIAPDLSSEYKESFKKDQAPFQSLSGLNDSLYADTFQYGLGKLLRFSDRNAMAHSREVRLPYLSHELVEFAFSLPSSYKMQNGWSKLILRESMQDVLPKEIAWRKDKKGFQAPASWLQEKRVKTLVTESVNNLQQYGIIDKPTASKSWQYIMVNKLLS